MLGSAQTGTGKTAAFMLPIIQQIDELEGHIKGRPLIRALIVTPTRELAIQIDDNIKAYSKHTRLKHAVIFGGVKQRDQVSKLRNGVHILVATPGRLLDLIGQGFISLDDVNMFVLDEADRMLDMGFIHDIRKLLKLLPHKRQSLFFSATMPKDIVDLSHKILDNPIKIAVDPTSSAADTVNQVAYFTNRTTKRDLLLHILKDEEMDQVLIFSRTKHGADKLTKHLRNARVEARAIHGDKSQNQRQGALEHFKEGKVRVLVATDIAARGIDISKLKYVINYDVPNVPETYVHRIGRSGRAGEEGWAISISEPEENAFIREIEKLIDQKIKVVKDHPFPQTDKPMTEQEKKDWNKEKNRRKQEFIEQKRAQKKGGRSSSRGENSKKRRFA
jgi:ATP-dependent RNA helicase RhlE